MPMPKQTIANNKYMNGQHMVNHRRESHIGSRKGVRGRKKLLTNLPPTPHERQHEILVQTRISYCFSYRGVGVDLYKKIYPTSPLTRTNMRFSSMINHLLPIHACYSKQYSAKYVNTMLLALKPITWYCLLSPAYSCNAPNSKRGPKAVGMDQCRVTYD